MTSCHLSYTHMHTHTHTYTHVHSHTRTCTHVHTHLYAHPLVDRAYGIKPVPFTTQGTEGGRSKVNLCGCKYTNTPPYCDGTVPSLTLSPLFLSLPPLSPLPPFSPLASLLSLTFALLSLTFATVHAPGRERWEAGVETQKNVRGEIGGWGRVPFNEPYAPSLSTIYDGA